MPRKSYSEVAEEVVEETKVEEPVVETPKATKKTAKKAGKKTKTLFLERKRGTGESNTLFVGVNGKNYLIKRGVPVEVPEAVYKVVMNGIKAEEELYNLIDSKATD